MCQGASPLYLNSSFCFFVVFRNIYFLRMLQVVALLKYVVQYIVVMENLRQLLSTDNNSTVATTDFA